MKMKDVEFLPEKVEYLMNFDIVKANMSSLMDDFNRVYEEALQVDHPEHVPEVYLSNMKSDLFTAFCHGAKEATFLESSYRRNFSLPKAIIEKIGEKKLVVPDKKIIV